MCRRRCRCDLVQASRVLRVWEREKKIAARLCVPVMSFVLFSTLLFPGSKLLISTWLRRLRKSDLATFSNILHSDSPHWFTGGGVGGHGGLSGFEVVFSHFLHLKRSLTRPVSSTYGTLPSWILARRPFPSTVDCGGGSLYSSSRVTYTFLKLEDQTVHLYFLIQPFFKQCSLFAKVNQWKESF